MTVRGTPVVYDRRPEDGRTQVAAQTEVPGDAALDVPVQRPRRSVVMTVEDAGPPSPAADAALTPTPEAERAPTHSGPWVRHDRRLVYDNPWLTVFHDEVSRPDGSPGIYGVVHFKRLAVGVVATDPDGRILLVGQHRYTLDEYSWEIPEGGVEPDETPLEGARRELREETGYEAAAWRQLCRITVSNSVTDERGAIFHATDVREGTATPDATEELVVRWAPLEEVSDMIDRGVIHDLLTIAGVSRFAAERAGRGSER